MRSSGSDQGTSSFDESPETQALEIVSEDHGKLLSICVQNWKFRLELGAIQLVIFHLWLHLGRSAIITSALAATVLSTAS